MPKYSQLTEAQRKETGYRVSYSSDTFTYCCGGREIGGLVCDKRVKYVKNYYNNDYHENEVYTTAEAAWKAELECMRDVGARPLMFNVLEDITPELAVVLREQPDCTEVMQWRNPGTDNIITMFILTNGADNEHKENDENDDDYSAR